MDIPPAVKTACVELSKLAAGFSTYYVLCGGGTPCRFAEVLEALFLYAAQAGGAREALRAVTERVPLEALELEHGQAVAFFEEEAGAASLLARRGGRRTSPCVSADAQAPQASRREASGFGSMRLGFQGV